MSIRTEFPAYADLLSNLPVRKRADIPAADYICPGCNQGVNPIFVYDPRLDFLFDPDLETYLCFYCIVEIWIGGTPHFIDKGNEKRFDELRDLVKQKPDFTDRYGFLQHVQVD